MNQPTPALETRITLAAAIQVSPRQIDYLVADKKIPVIRLGKRCVRFRLDAVLAALEQGGIEA